MQKWKRHELFKQGRHCGLDLSELSIKNKNIALLIFCLSSLTSSFHSDIIL